MQLQGIVFSVGRVIERKNHFRGWGGEGKQRYLIGIPDSKRESDLCMFLKNVLHIFTILLCVYIEDHIGN